MSRRSFKTINLPREVVDWIDSLLKGDGARRPLGIASRDEFVRIAVALLGMALEDQDRIPPLQSLQELVQALNQHRQPSRTADFAESPQDHEGATQA
ncbi:MAG: hypothetical protein LC623_09845 [Halobacteriales archaeon]|nr:hypothetical protein [Halobacteriales archaeon]